MKKRVLSTLARTNEKFGWILTFVSIPSVLNDLTWWSRLAGTTYDAAPPLVQSVMSGIGAVIGPLEQVYTALVQFLFGWLGNGSASTLYLLILPALSFLFFELTRRRFLSAARERADEIDALLAKLNRDERYIFYRRNTIDGRVLFGETKEVDHNSRIDKAQRLLSSSEQYSFFMKKAQAFPHLGLADIIKQKGVGDFSIITRLNEQYVMTNPVYAKAYALDRADWGNFSTHFKLWRLWRVLFLIVGAAVALEIIVRFFL